VWSQQVLCSGVAFDGVDTVYPSLMATVAPWIEVCVQECVKASYRHLLSNDPRA
jgi:hypothetical protein